MNSTAFPTDDTESNAVEGGGNPLLGEWPGGYGGVPPLDRVEVAHFRPAIIRAMEEMDLEIAAIVNDRRPPTFDNTMEALECSGGMLDRVVAIYRLWSANLTTPAFQAVEREMAPRLTAHWSRILQNRALFERIRALYEARGELELSAEQDRLLWLYYTNHLRAGASLEESSRQRVAEINERLSSLFTEFSANLLADESGQFLVLKRESDLEGLPDGFRHSLAAAARERGIDGSWVVANTRSAVEPFLTLSSRRDLRESAWRMFVSRGDLDNENDNKALITEIVALRAERARLLGYRTHANYRLEQSMARTPEAALGLMRSVWEPARSRVAAEVESIQVEIRAGGDHFDPEPWDYRYYAEKVRRRRYDLDRDQVTAYLQLDRLRDGMFWVASRLFGLSFDRADDVPVFHPDVEVWAVHDDRNDRHVGLFYFDPYARSGKRSGAWMTSYRRQESFRDEVTTLVSNNSNFAKGSPGEPVLISWTDSTTLFHEFGHALNGLASNVAYPSLSGTPTERDYVEFPSQLLEHWLSNPEVLRRFAVHHRTGEPIPAELVERIERASNFNQGFETIEYLANALLDMELHLLDGEAADPATFEREALARIGMPREVTMRHRLPHFAHAFSSDGYSAGYYGYLWADVLTADAYEAFEEGEGAFDADVAARLYEHVLSRGGSLDPGDGYRAFRGRDPEIHALMRKRGFTAESEPT